MAWTVRGWSQCAAMFLSLIILFLAYLISITANGLVILSCQDQLSLTVRKTMPPLLSCERHQRCLQWCHLWWKRWEIVMTISFLLIGATFSGVTLFKMGLRQDLYGYSFLVVFIFCLLGLGASLAYGGLILYKREYKGTRRQEECTSTLLSNQDCHRNSVMGETQYHSKPPPQNYSDVSLPLSTPPPSYHSIPLALEVAAANQIQPIYNARGRDSRSSSISYHPTEAPPGNCYPPMYEEAVGESSSRAFLSGSRGIYPYHWPFPPCEGAQWIDPRMGGYSREAVELHNMYHFLVEEEGWISPLMTVSEEDEARRRRFQLIFDHDFFY